MDPVKPEFKPGDRVLVWIDDGSTNPSRYYSAEFVGMVEGDLEAVVKADGRNRIEKVSKLMRIAL